MDRTGLPEKQSTILAMSEITGAIISITLVMAAVFVPVGFMQGPAGVFYKQFAFTLATAILISAVNALTLSPALCAVFLKISHTTDAEGHITRKGFWSRFFRGFNAGFRATTNRYKQSVQFLIRRKWIAIAGLVIII